MTYKIKYEEKKCIGVGQCATLSNLWKINNKGKAVLKDAIEVSPGVFEVEITDEQYKKELAAAKSCPVQAIQIMKV